MLVFDPDESVVATIRLVFEQFQLLGTAYRVMRYFAIHEIHLPRRLWRPGEIGTLHWGTVSHNRITTILHNPTYTGTYVYGRRRSLPVVEAGQIVKVKTKKLSQDDWKFMIHQAHPAYISWEEYLANQEQLSRNYGAAMPDGRIGVPRVGAALLQGLVICGQCGRRMSPRYYGDGGKRAAYECNQRRKQDGQVGICWSVAAATIDAALEAHVLEEVNSEQLNISLAVLEELDRQAAQLEHHWQIKLERARYEANRAERQFDAVEPENRLVARTLEKRWNEKLQQLAELEAAYASARAVERLELSDEQRQQVLRLASNLPAVWRSSTTTASERKEMLALLVKQVAITPVESPIRSTRIAILWHTGATTQVTVKRPTTQEKLQTPPEIIEAVRELATSRTDAEIAEELNQQGFLTGKGRKFTKDAVNWIRWKFQIGKPTVAHPTGIRADGCYSTKALAQKLGVGIHTIHYWREKGIVEASQETSNGSWWHRVIPIL